MLEFWRKSVGGLYKHVYATPSLTKHKIKSSFMIDRIVPFGMDNIVQELVMRGHLIPLDLLKTRQYYQQKEAKMGWTKWILLKLYYGTIGYFFSKTPTIPESTSLVSVAYLNVNRKSYQCEISLNGKC